MPLVNGLFVYFLSLVLRAEYGTDCDRFCTMFVFNPLVTNRRSHSYHLDESIFILGASGVIFHIYFIFR